jgi:hypothetical protein
LEIQATTWLLLVSTLWGFWLALSATLSNFSQCLLGLAFFWWHDVAVVIVAVASIAAVIVATIVAIVAVSFFVKLFFCICCLSFWTKLQMQLLLLDWMGSSLPLTANSFSAKESLWRTTLSVQYDHSSPG